MNIKKHIPTFARWFASKPKQAVLPLQTADNTTTGPAYSFVLSQAKETPRKRCAYIPTGESPWLVISKEKGKWIVALYYIWGTREEARTQASAYSAAYKVQTRVVRPLIPTR